MCEQYKLCQVFARSDSSFEKYIPLSEYGFLPTTNQPIRMQDLQGEILFLTNQQICFPFEAKICITSFRCYFTHKYTVEVYNENNEEGQERDLFVLIHMVFCTPLL